MATKASRPRGARVTTLHTESPEAVAPAGALLERSVEETERVRVPQPAERRISGIVIGRVADSGDGAAPTVEYDGNPSDAAGNAVSTVAVTPDDVGREVALAFQDGDPAKPVILGFIHQSAGTREREPEPELDARVDGERITFTAKKEIVLSCGKASITLTRARKVLIRGAYLLSRSSGVNRIKGGSVQIN